MMVPTAVFEHTIICPVSQNCAPSVAQPIKTKQKEREMWEITNLQMGITPYNKSSLYDREDRQRAFRIRPG